MIALRRWFVLSPGTHVEARMRNALYARLQDLPVSFHDRWPSGQLLSRAVSDLGLIRRWLSFGLVLLVVNLVVIVVGVGILVSMNWMLGLVFLVCSIPLWMVGYRFEGRYSEVSRRSQDQAGDLATAVEESVHGIRVLKAFGRGKHALSTFRAQAESLRSTEIEKARLDADIWTWIIVVPTVALAICLVLGVWLAANGAAHRRRARRVLRDRDRAGVADRVDRVPARVRARRAHRDRPVLRHPRQRERDHRPRATASRSSARGRARLHRRALPLPGLARPVRRPARRRRPRPRARRDHGARRPHRQRQDHDDRAHDAPLRRHRRARSRSTASTCARFRARSCARTSRWRSRTRRCSAPRCARTCCSAGRSSRATSPRCAPRPSGARRGAPHRAGRLRVRPARRRRHEGRRRGHEPLGRPAAAPRARACGRGEARGARARRPAVGARRRDRGAASRPSCAACSPRPPRSSWRTGRRR